MSVDAVPIIDLAAFEKGNSKLRTTIAEQTDAACTATGFLVIMNHEVNPITISNMWITIQQFFDLPTATKKQSQIPSPGYPYGYMGNEEETLAASRGNLLRQI